MPEPVNPSFQLSLTSTNKYILSEQKKKTKMVTVQDAGLAVFRVVRDEQSSEDRIEWLLLQGSKWHEKMFVSK